MPTEHTSDHEHELEAEYLYPTDAEVLDIYEGEKELHIDVAVVCPECSETLALTTTVTSVTGTDVDLPLDEDFYD